MVEEFIYSESGSPEKTILDRRMCEGVMHYKEAKGLLSADNSMNIYRGCSHECIYCDGRSACYQFTHEFQDVEVKKNAVELLEDALRKKRKKCMIKTGYISDSYNKYEENLKITRECLEIIYKYKFGVTIQTKSKLILRDIDILKKINESTKCVVQVTMTTYDDELCKYIEPNVSPTKERFEILKVLHENNIPAVVWLSPILPFINDTVKNINGLLGYCKKAEVTGLICYGIGVTLRNGNRQYFYSQLDRYFPGIRKLYEQTFGDKYDCRSNHEYEIMEMIKLFCNQNNVLLNQSAFDYLDRYEEQGEGIQMTLYDYL